MSKLTKSAKDQPCLIRIPGYCTFNNEETVFCHFNGGGMALKKHDIHGAFGCNVCHAIVDGRIQTGYSKEYIELAFRQANELTIDYWIENNLITVE